LFNTIGKIAQINSNGNQVDGIVIHFNLIQSLKEVDYIVFIH